MSIRLGIWTQTFPLASETFIVTKALGLLDAGVDVKVFSVNTGKDGSDFKILKQKPEFRKRHIVSPYQHFPGLRFIPEALLLMLQKLLSQPRLFFKLWRSNKQLCRELGLHPWQKFMVKLPLLGHSLDILHLEYDFQAYGMQDLPSILNCKLVISCRAEVTRMNVYRRFPNFYPHIFRNLDGYHFIATHLREQAKAKGLPDHVKTSIIYPAIDLDLFLTETSPGGSPRLEVISVGQLWWHKGYEFALEAFALLKKEFPHARYRIVGHGDQEAALDFAVRQLGLQPVTDVEFLGLQPREKIAQLLQSADIFLHAALQEGFCNAVIEAQASGLPVVSSDAGGLPENVATGESGFIVPRRNSKALGARLLELARDPELRRNMGRAGQKRVKNQFGLPQQISAFVQFYQSLL